jgi:hypothetical protein
LTITEDTAPGAVAGGTGWLLAPGPDPVTLVATTEKVYVVRHANLVIVQVRPLVVHPLLAGELVTLYVTTPPLPAAGVQVIVAVFPMSVATTLPAAPAAPAGMVTTLIPPGPTPTLLVAVTVKV